MDRPRTAAPDRAALHEAALQHLARYAVTEAGLLRVLERRIARWARESGPAPEEAQAAHDAAREVARSLAGAGVVDDAAFAAARTRRLLQAGRSRRAVAAHLASKGVAADLAERVLPEPGDELAVALAFARRRRLGPFRTAPADAAARLRELGAFGRAGFPRDVAERAIATDREQADALVARLKQG